MGTENYYKFSCKVSVLEYMGILVNNVAQKKTHFKFNGLNLNHCF